jgi:hypothetical protein
MCFKSSCTSFIWWFSQCRSHEAAALFAPTLKSKVLLHLDSSWGLLYLFCVGLYRKEPWDWLMADQAILVSTEEVTASKMCLDLKGQPLNPSMWRQFSNIWERFMMNAFYSENVVILIVWYMTIVKWPLFVHISIHTKTSGWLLKGTSHCYIIFPFSSK